MTLGSGMFLSSAEQTPAKVNWAIRQLIEGRSNALGTFTLTAGATSTVVTSTTCGPNSLILWMPTTAHAASQMATLFCASVSPGSFTLTHANNANVDQTFNYIALG